MSSRRPRPPLLLATGVVVALLILVGACSSEPERSVANFCTQAETLRTLDEDLASGDPVRIDARAVDLRLLQQVAPTEIEPSVAVLVGVTDDFATTAGTATDRDDVAKVVFRGRSGDIEAIEAAGTSVSDYTRANCDVDLGGSSTSTTAPTSVTEPGTGGATTTTGPGDPSTPTTAGPAPSSTTTTSTPSLLVD